MHARIHNKLCDLQVDEMIDNMKNAVSDTLEGSHWMDEESRDAAQDKVDCILINIFISRVVF